MLFAGYIIRVYTGHLNGTLVYAVHWIDILFVYVIHWIDILLCSSATRMKLK